MKETKKLNNEEMEKVTGGEASDYVEDYVLASKCDELAELEAQGLIDSHALQAASAEPEAIADLLAENRNTGAQSRYLRARRRTSLPHQRRRTSASRSSAGRLA